MQSHKWMLGGLCLMLALSACSPMDVREFASNQPAFDPMVFFDGHTRSWGMIETPSGAPEEPFQGDNIGHRNADGTLDLRQDFTYADKKPNERQWHFVRMDDHNYEGTANDVIGTAHGEAYGNAFHWVYTLAINPGNPLKNVTMDQWMYLQSDGTMVNRVDIRKLGFTVAMVTEYFQKIAPGIP